jgi:putative tryptophan/tyrosine transport system substrate-binding protein
MQRREFFAALGAALTYPVNAGAQQGTLPVIGLLSRQRESEGARSAAAFRQGLSDQGYVERRNIEILYRWADGQGDRLPALAADLVRSGVALIATPGGGTGAALAAKSATAAIPIVFSVGSDPVEQGLVTSFNRPGGNITGATRLIQELTAKQLQLLHDVVPAATSIGFLVDPQVPYVAAQIREAEQAAPRLGVSLIIATAKDRGEIETEFARLVARRVGALQVDASDVFSRYRDQVVALAMRYSLPTMCVYREFVDAGGLMSYGTTATDADRLAGTYAGRILKGEKPGNLPVIQPTKFETVINLKTAKVLGLTIPEQLLATADEVIQ